MICYCKAMEPSASIETTVTRHTAATDLVFKFLDGSGNEANLSKIKNLELKISLDRHHIVRDKSMSENKKISLMFKKCFHHLDHEPQLSKGNSFDLEVSCSYKLGANIVELESMAFMSIVMIFVS